MNGQRSLFVPGEGWGDATRYSNLQLFSCSQAMCPGLVTQEVVFLDRWANLTVEESRLAILNILHRMPDM